MTNEPNSDSTKALLKRKNGPIALEKLFEQDLSWDEELDRLNHDENFFQPSRTSTPTKHQILPHDEKDDLGEQYFYEATVVSFL